MTTIVNLSMPSGYGELLGALKERIRTAQSVALQAVMQCYL